MKLSLSIKLLTTLAVLGTVSSQAFAADNEQRQSKQERRAAAQEERTLQGNQGNRGGVDRNAAEAARMEAERQNQAIRGERNFNPGKQNAFDRNAAEAARIEAERNQNPLFRGSRGYNPGKQAGFDVNAAEAAQMQAQKDQAQSQAWQNNMAVTSWNPAFQNWNAQRNYLTANMARMNQLNTLSALQQQELNAQMQAAYINYNGNNYNGAYNWQTYSQPQFLDYLQMNQPSLFNRVVGYLGVGGGGIGGLGGLGGVGLGGLGNNVWNNNERDQLTRDMANIHQLAVEGRITHSQEKQLDSQLKTEYNAYKNNNYNGGYGWNQYSDPGFVDYLHRSQPGLLTTIRNYVGR